MFFEIEIEEASLDRRIAMARPLPDFRQQATQMGKETLACLYSLADAALLTRKSR